MNKRKKDDEKSMNVYEVSNGSGHRLPASATPEAICATPEARRAERINN